MRFRILSPNNIVFVEYKNYFFPQKNTIVVNNRYFSKRRNHPDNIEKTRFVIWPVDLLENSPDSGETRLTHCLTTNDKAREL